MTPVGKRLIIKRDEGDLEKTTQTRTGYRANLEREKEIEEIVEGTVIDK